jgi:crotonobetainyl-CoA:carnitine CoA-transferase CaiB-like acyl-CoA transferase
MPATGRGRWPIYDQHTRQVLAECGFGDSEIEALVAEGAVVAA